MLERAAQHGRVLLPRNVGRALVLQAEEGRLGESSAVREVQGSPSHLETASLQIRMQGRKAAEARRLRTPPASELARDHPSFSLVAQRARRRLQGFRAAPIPPHPSCHRYVAFYNSHLLFKMTRGANRVHE